MGSEFFVGFLCKWRVLKTSTDLPQKNLLVELFSTDLYWILGYRKESSMLSNILLMSTKIKLQNVLLKSTM